MAPLERTLADDESGRIVYVPGFLGYEQAQADLGYLREAVPWREEKRPMYDRIVDVPRLVAWYDLEAGELPAPIARVRPLVEKYCRTHFSRVGLNLYRDAADSVAPHGDHTEELDRTAPIALLSLGATRLMSLRSKTAPRRIADLDLESGSLLVMDFASQLAWNHGIPKSRKAVGPRISLAFRKGPAR